MKEILKPKIKLGADRRKIAILGGLAVVLAGVWWINREDTTTVTPAARPAAPSAGAIPPPVVRGPQRAAPSRTPSRAGQRGAAPQEFKPSLKPKDQAVDPTQVDPTIRLDLLAKLQTVKVEGAMRSLFEFGAAPPPKDVAPIKPKPTDVKPVETAKVDPPKPEQAKAPPITLKFYGFINTARTGTKSAFFLDGEEIFVASEGELVRNRYKIVRIGVNSAVVEDTQFKDFKDNQQTIRLVEEAPIG